MHTADQARELWCPMVRIARHEFYERDESGHGHITSHQVIVGGCNTDALGVGNGEPRRMSRDHKPLASCRCIADKCAMWRWGEAEPELREAKTWWPEEDAVEVEPVPRPPTVPQDAVWIPLSVDGENIEGSYWQEPDGTLEADNERAAASRRGYCGLSGRGEMFT